MKLPNIILASNQDRNVGVGYNFGDSITRSWNLGKASWTFWSFEICQKNTSNDVERAPAGDFYTGKHKGAKPVDLKVI